MQPQENKPNPPQPEQPGDIPAQPNSPPPGYLSTPMPSSPPPSTPQAPQPIYPANPSGSPQPTVYPATQPGAPNPISQPAGLVEYEHKDFVMAFLLSWLLGVFGADRFYLGYTGVGIAKLLTFGGLGIWAYIDVALLAFGKIKDKAGLPLKGYEKNKTWVRVLALIHLVFILLIAAFIIFSVFITTKSGLYQAAGDAKRKADINTIHDSLEIYHGLAFKYPTLVDINSADFRRVHMSSLQDSALQDPKGTSTTLVSTLSSQAYSYVPAPVDCDNVKTECTSYVLTAVLESGGTYVRQSP